MKDERIERDAANDLITFLEAVHRGRYQSEEMRKAARYIKERYEPFHQFLDRRLYDWTQWCFLFYADQEGLSMLPKPSGVEVFEKLSLLRDTYGGKPWKNMEKEVEK